MMCEVPHFTISHPESIVSSAIQPSEFSSAAGGLHEKLDVCRCARDRVRPWRRHHIAGCDARFSDDCQPNDIDFPGGHDAIRRTSAGDRCRQSYVRSGEVRRTNKRGVILVFVSTPRRRISLRFTRPARFSIAEHPADNPRIALIAAVPGKRFLVPELVRRCAVRQFQQQRGADVVGAVG
jgi:hypothetical protein